jgi:hypothetical protein
MQARAHEGARAATLRLCTRCRAPIITGLDADRAAITAYCDPTPLTQFGEAVALLQGRFTYDLTSCNGRKELWHRYSWNIGKFTDPVLAAHRCGQPMNAFTAPLPEPLHAGKAAADDVPPF